MDIKFEDLREPQPGTGQGVNLPKKGEGGRETCKCPQCNYTTQHERNIPCNQKKCPNCNIPLTG